MTALETVYAVHNFEAENDDELTFQIGEPVIVIQKDDGFNDGWWKGKNMRGEVGIFPMNYITLEPYQQQQQQQQQQSLAMLPTPSTSDKSKKSSLQYLSHIDTAAPEEQQLQLKEATSPSARSSYSFTCPISSTSPTTSNNSNNSHSNNVLRRLVISSLFLPSLRSISPEEWDVDQVEVWLNSMNFGSIAANFKSQEITGDILLELNMEALKELAVPTFGKRFKIHTALNVLREECGYQTISIPSNNRMSIASSTYSEHQRHESPTSPNSSRYSNPLYHRQSPSYHSNLIIEKQQGRKSHPVSRKQYDEESIKSLKSDTPVVPSTSDYDIMETSIKNYEKERNSQNLSNQEIKSEMAIQQAQKRHTVLPMAQKSSMDIYSSRAIDENGNVTPDMEGWLHKQGCKYKKWNKRWFVLKGPNLFYFKSPKDVRMKGIINLRGYRIIPDESIQPGKYCFKAQHEEERTFYFYTDVDTSMRAWTSSLMKATISRDFNAPVLSSSVIPTVSLDVARRMRPRPPSVLLYRKDNKTSDGGLSPRSYGDTTEEHSSANLSSHQSGPDDQPTALVKDEQLTNQDSGFDSDPQGSNVAYDKEEEEEEEDPILTNQDEDLEDNDETEPFEEDEGNFEQEEEELEHLNDTMSVESFSSWTSAEYIQWVNTICSSVKIKTLSELRQGDALIELLEELSGKTVKQLPPSSVGSISMLMLDNVVAVFKFLSVEGIDIDDERFTIKDIFSGREDKIKLMLQTILNWSIQLNDQ